MAMWERKKKVTSFLNKLVVPALTITHLTIAYHMFKKWVLDIFATSQNVILIAVSLLWILTLFYTMICYLSAAYMDPGYYSEKWEKIISKDKSYKELLDYDGEPCYCPRCRKKRPIRTHHCKICNKCVMVMDHHCGFIDNCIGHRNYKAFILFLCFHIIQTLCSLTLIFRNILQGMKNWNGWLLLFSCAYFIPIGALVFAQFIHQLPLLKTNTTNVEAQQNKLQKVSYNRRKIPFYNRFSLGSIEGNIRVRLGHNVLLWFIPTPNTDCPYDFVENPMYVPIYQTYYNDNVDISEDPAVRLRNIINPDID